MDQHVTLFYVKNTTKYVFCRVAFSAHKCVLKLHLNYVFNLTSHVNLAVFHMCPKATTEIPLGVQTPLVENLWSESLGLLKGWKRTLIFYLFCITSCSMKIRGSIWELVVVNRASAYRHQLRCDFSLWVNRMSTCSTPFTNSASELCSRARLPSGRLRILLRLNVCFLHHNNTLLKLDL